MAAFASRELIELIGKYHAVQECTYSRMRNTSQRKLCLHSHQSHDSMATIIRHANESAQGKGQFVTTLRTGFTTIAACLRT